LFVSSRLAKQFPDLREAKMIAQFSTPWPRQSYLRVQDVSKKYNKKFSALTRSASILLIFFVGNFLSVPPGIQDLMVQLGSTTAVGYVVLIHVQLYEIFPALVILPALVIALIAHFVIQSSKADAQLKLARLFPARKKKVIVQPQSTVDEQLVLTSSASPSMPQKGSQAVHVASKDRESPSESESEYETDSGEENEEDDLDVDAEEDEGEGDDGKEAGIAVAVSMYDSRNTHQSRRQSIQAGLNIIQRMQKNKGSAGVAANSILEDAEEKGHSNGSDSSSNSNNSQVSDSSLEETDSNLTLRRRSSLNVANVCETKEKMESDSDAYDVSSLEEDEKVKETADDSEYDSEEEDSDEDEDEEEEEGEGDEDEEEEGDEEEEQYEDEDEGAYFEQLHTPHGSKEFASPRVMQRVALLPKDATETEEEEDDWDEVSDEADWENGIRNN
jgi:hypothetical protein